MFGTNITIIIAEDHPTFLLGLERSLADRQNITIIGKAANGFKLLELLLIHIPDIIVMDINMPLLNGIETAKRVRKDYPDVKIIFITMHEDDRIINQCKLYGDGYLSKSSTGNELIKAIDAIMVGKSYFLSLHSKNPLSYPDHTPGLNYNLTKRELEIITFLRRGFTTKQIAQELFLSNLTVETHRKNILRKLKVKNTAELISFAINNNIT